VKHRDNSSITLRASEAVTAIAHFIENRRTNPGLRFLYTTNASVGREQKSPMSKEIRAIDAWEQIRQGSLQGTEQNKALQGIRTILLEKVEKPPKLNEGTWKIFRNFITSAENNKLLDVIRRFEWNTKADDAQSLGTILEQLLIERQHATDNIQAQEQYQKLFVYVFKRLCKRGIKQLTVEERSHQLSQPTLSEIDHQLLNNVVVWVQALEVRVQEHEVRLGVLEQHLDRERAETYIGQEVADCVDNLLRDYTKLFVGRETTLKQLDEFLSQKRTNLLTLIAPAGFGKTALLANWVASRKDDGCFIVYHFFSQRYDVTRSFSAAYRNLLRQLYDYYEPSDRQIPNNEDGLRDKLYLLIKEYSQRDGRPLVIVLDALDEAEPPFRQFLPLLPENVFLIASARLARAEEGQEPEYLRGWTDNALPIYLDRLPKPPDPAIAHWIRQAGEGELAAFAEDTHFVAQLDKITEGFPLYLRYLTGELIQAQQKGEDMQVVLTRSPKGFGAYVQEQFQRLAQVEEIRRVQELFALLSVALGALSGDDIQELTDLNEWDLAALPWQATRWFSIQTGFYSFAHPLLAQEFQGVLKRQASSAKEKLIKYCSCWQENWQKHQSRYALRHYAEHLREAKQWEDLYAIARNEDFAVAQQEHLPDELDLPLKTVQTALRGAAEEDKAGVMAEFLLVHAHRLGQTTAQESPLDALRAGSLTRALALADLYDNDIERCVLWYLLLAWELKDIGRLEEAQATLKRLQHKELPRLPTRAAIHWQGDFAVYLLTYIFEISKDACTALHQRLLNDSDCHHLLCNLLINCGDFTTALETVQGISSELEQLFQLEKIAKVQAAKGQMKEARTTFAKALEITQKPIPNSFWVCRMGSIAEAQTEVGDREVARATFTEALETAQKIDNKSQQVNTFIALVDKLTKVGMFAKAFDTLQKIESQSGLKDFLRAKVLRATAEVEVKAGNIDKARKIFTSVLKIASGVEDKKKQVDALVDLARVQAEVGEFTAALETTETIDSQWNKAEALLLIATVQAKAKDFPAALATISRIQEPMSKTQALLVVVKAQAEAGKLTDALETSEAIDDQVWRTESLVAIVKAQAEAGDFTAALETRNRIKDKTGQHNALSAIAKTHIKAKNFPAALSIALAMDSPLMQLETFKFIAKAQAEANQTQAARATLATALKLAQGAEPAFLQALALADVAEVQVKAEPKEAGVTTASIAHQIAQRIDNLREQAIATAVVAEILAKAGKRKEAKANFDSAIEIAQEIKNQQERVNSFTVIAEAQTRIEEFSAAIETVQRIEWSDQQAKVLAAVAKAQAKAGREEEAHKTVNTAFKIAQSHYSVWGSIGALCKVAVAQAAVGQKEEALELLAELYEDVRESREQDKNLSRIAAVQAEVGGITTALKITDEIEDGWERVKALSWIAWTQFKKKERLLTTLTAALKAKDNIKDEEKRVKALRAIAGIQARAGVAEQALHTAERILTDRNELLCTIATILVEVNDKKNFKQLLIPSAYYLDAAYNMCGHLARLYPQQAAAVAKVVTDFR
jgi:predicted negative regulator of RcsB-dependent stress response